MIRSQNGFILIECMMSLFILSLVVLTLVANLPSLIILLKQVEHEQYIKTHLYQIADQLLNQQLQPFETLSYNTPIPYNITNNNQTLCAEYTLETAYEKKYCLLK